MLFAQNKKIKNSTDDKYIVINFGLPAYQSKSGLKTCPMAGACAKGCYATQGAYVWSNVAQAYEKRLEASLKEDFVEQVQIELDQWIKRANKQQKQLVVRIHDSGDYYNIEYVNKWLRIMHNNTGVKFYSYTKMVPLFKRLSEKLPNNFTIIYSYGGLADNMIDPTTDRHSAVFESIEALSAAGYADTTENDLNALGTNHRIGLVYHGAKSKKMELKSAS